MILILVPIVKNIHTVREFDNDAIKIRKYNSLIFRANT